MVKWQTRRTQNAVPNGVWVRLPPQLQENQLTLSWFFVFNVLTLRALLYTSHADVNVLDFIAQMF